MSPEIIGLLVAFIGGVLVDHFLFNKLAGMVSSEVAKLQGEVAAVTARLPIHTLPAAAPPAVPLVAAAPPAKPAA